MGPSVSGAVSGLSTDVPLWAPSGPGDGGASASCVKSIQINKVSMVALPVALGCGGVDHLTDNVF